MRARSSLLLLGLLAGCTSAVTPPATSVVTEVPQTGIASSSGGPTAGIAGSPDGNGPRLDQDRINLMQWTLEQQKIDAAIAEQKLLEARNQLVIVQPGPLPNRVDGVNIALYAKQSTNAVGDRVYDRTTGSRVSGIGNCGRFQDQDEAQRAFLGGGGPQTDRYGLDPDGDGFACKWDPAPYRNLN